MMHKEVVSVDNDVGATQAEIKAQIERVFETVTSKELRHTEKRLNALIAQLADAREQVRYQMAMDALPDMLKHLDVGR
jgi:hypothetical protein